MQMITLNKNLLILTVGRVIQVVISLLTLRVITTLLNQKEVGNYYLLITLLTLFSFAFFNPIGQYYGRHLINWNNSKNLKNATLILFTSRTLGIFLSLIISVILYYEFNYKQYYSLSSYLFFIFFSLLAGIHGVLLSAINTLGNRVKFTIYNVVTLILSLGLSLVIVKFIDKSAIGWLYGPTAAQLLISYFLYYSICKRQKFSYFKTKQVLNNKNIKKILYFTTPVTITLFLQWGQSSSFRFIIELKYSLEVLGFIGVGLSIATAIFNSVESLATQLYTPTFYKSISNSSKSVRANTWNHLAQRMVPIYILLAAYIIILSPYLIKVLVDDKFKDAFIYVAIGSLVELFRTLTNLVYLISQSEVKTNTTVTPYLIGFTLTTFTLFILNMSEMLWLIPLTLALTNCTILILLYMNMKKILPVSLNIHSILKSLLLIIPMLPIFFIENRNTYLQSISIIVLSGMYFLFAVYLLTRDPKKIVL